MAPSGRWSKGRSSSGCGATVATRAHRISPLPCSIFAACTGVRIPECGGYARERPSPAAYPQANAPQLWNATAFPLIVQSLLGLVPLAPFETLVVDPALPDWLRT